METNDQEDKQVLKAVVMIIVGFCVLFLTICFTACSTTKCVPEIIVHDSIRTEYSVKYDSVYQYIHDSTFIKEKGDTVFFTKYKTVYKDKYVMKNDTVYKNVDHKVVEKETTNILTKGQKGMITGFWVLLVLILLVIAGWVLYKFTPYGKIAWNFIKGLFHK